MCVGLLGGVAHPVRDEQNKIILGEEKCGVWLAAVREGAGSLRLRYYARMQPARLPEAGLGLGARAPSRPTHSLKTHVFVQAAWEAHALSHILGVGEDEARARRHAHQKGHRATITQHPEKDPNQSA